MQNFHRPLFASLITSVVLFGCTNPSEDSSQESNQEISPEQWAENYHQEMQQLVESSEDFATINALEKTVSQLEGGVLKDWRRSFLDQNADLYADLFTDSAATLDWTSGTSESTRTTQGITEATWTPASGDSHITDFFANIDTVQSISLKVVDIEQASAESNSAISTVETDIRLTLADGNRQQIRGHITLECTRNDAGDWKVNSMTSSTLEVLSATRAPAYRDISADLGLTALPVEDRKEAIRRGGYALVVADYDQDGMTDMLVGNYGPINLLRNTGSGFEDVTTAAGLDAEEVIKGAGFVDMDNDGDRDIVMLRFTDSDDDRGDFVIYENDGDGTFTKHTDLLPRRRSYDTPMPLSLGDYNNDGWIDIYIGFPGVRDFTSGINGSERPDWQASQGIWFNKGDWNFEEAEDDNAVVTDNSTYSHAAASTDLDGDGWIDLLVVDDSGRINPVFRNSGNGNFETLGEDSGLNYTGMSMGVTTGDFNNDGLLDIMSSHVALNAGSRIAYSMDGLTESGTTMDRLMEHVRTKYVDMQLFVNNGDGTFSDITANANLNWSGEAAGAGEWLDYNHDGLLDYYLPNGLYSSGEESLDSLFTRADFLLFGPAALGETDVETIPFNIMNDVSGGAIFSKSEEGGANPVLTLLRNYKNGGEKPAMSFGGKQHNALYRNNGDGTFTEVGFLEGVDRLEDGYIVAPVDIDGDGKQDMVLRNTDPALGYTYQPVIALHNELDGNTFTVQLNSTSGNTDGLGARVTAYIGTGETTQIQSREIRSVNGAVQAEPVAYFGLGDTSVDTISKVVVTWPGGQQQEVTDITGSRLVITKE